MKRSGSAATRPNGTAPGRARRTDRVRPAGPAPDRRLGELLSPGMPAQTVEGTVAGEVAGLAWTEQMALRFQQPGEIIELVVRPSRWSVLFTSARWLLVCVLLALAAPILALQTGLSQSQVVQGAIAMALARLTFGMAQWFAVLYILTNRRVMSVRGLFRQQVLSTQHTEIRAIHLTRSWYERRVGVGTITIVTDEFSQVWIHLRDSKLIRNKLLRLVSRS